MVVWKEAAFKYWFPVVIIDDQCGHGDVRRTIQEQLSLVKVFHTTRVLQQLDPCARFLNKGHARYKYIHILVSAPIDTDYRTIRQQIN